MHPSLGLTDPKLEFKPSRQDDDGLVVCIDTHEPMHIYAQPYYSMLLRSILFSKEQRNHPLLPTSSNAERPPPGAGLLEDQ